MIPACVFLRQRQRSRCARANCSDSTSSASRSAAVRAPDVVTSRITWPEKSPPPASRRPRRWAGCRGRAPGARRRRRRCRRTGADAQGHRPSGGPCRRRRCPPSRCATGRACSGRDRRRAGRRTARTPRCRARACRPRLRIRSIDVWPAPKNRSARNGNMFSTATITSLDASSSATCVGEPLGVAALPPERRMHDDGLGAELLGGAHAALQLGDRVGAPHPLRDQQARRMHRQHRHRHSARTARSIASTS